MNTPASARRCAGALSTYAAPASAAPATSPPSDDGNALPGCSPAHVLRAAMFPQSCGPAFGCGSLPGFFTIQFRRLSRVALLPAFAGARFGAGGAPCVASRAIAPTALKVENMRMSDRPRAGSSGAPRLGIDSELERAGAVVGACVRAGRALAARPLLELELERGRALPVRYPTRRGRARASPR